jgi:predicted RNA polymerase sigma factor
MPAPGEDSERLLRDLAPQVLGSIVRRFRDFAAAEDAVQEALAAAAVQWPKQGVPANPRGWLIRVALRRMVDQVRSESSRRRREEIVVSLVRRRIRSCSPPQRRASRLARRLARDAVPVLPPRAVARLRDRAHAPRRRRPHHAEIAKAFLVPEATMAQRSVGPSRPSRTRRIPFATERDDLPARVGPVMHVLYLMFNEGYAGASGPAVVRTICRRKRFGSPANAHLFVPDDAEVAGLLALLLLTDARREARTGPAGELVPLDRRTRSRWDRAAIAEGQALLERALASGRVGATSSSRDRWRSHDEAPSTDETDWAQIEALYGVLDQLSDNPMVALNLAVATGDGARSPPGLARLEELDRDPRIHGHYRLDAVRGHLLERAGDRDDASRRTGARRRARERRRARLPPRVRGPGQSP